REIRRVDQSMDRLNKMAGTLRSTLGLLGVGVSLRGLQSLATASLRTADALANTADRLSLNVEALQELRFAASQYSIQSGTVDMALQRLTRRLGEAAQGSGTLLKTLEQYNIAAVDAEGR